MQSDANLTDLTEGVQKGGEKDKVGPLWGVLASCCVNYRPVNMDTAFLYQGAWDMPFPTMV